MHAAALLELQQTLQREMPICTPMGIRPVSWDGRELAMEMPLAPNRNHQYSAFAGSLNALCTVVGWAIALPFYARFRGRIVYWL